MKKIFNWQVILGLALVALSGLTYFVHYLIFRDAHHIFLYLIGDIAFVFLEVLIVTLILHQLLDYREKKSLLHKMNMIIGVFFSEVGTELLKMFSVFDSHATALTQQLIVTNQWTGKEFLRMCASAKKHDFAVESTRGNLDALKHFLKDKRQFLLSLLENPNLLEHESFTNTLWAVFHLTEELSCRQDLHHLAETDYQHLSGDIKRVYEYLIVEWLNYMRHLKNAYPYLFSLAMRTNPFDANASVEVK